MTAFRYQAPESANSKLVRQIAGGWTWRGVLLDTSVTPVSVATSGTNLNTLLLQGNTRTNRVPGAFLVRDEPNGGSMNGRTHKPVLNSAAWTDTPAGARGHGAPDFNGDSGRAFRVRAKMLFQYARRVLNVFNCCFC